MLFFTKDFYFVESIFLAFSECRHFRFEKIRCIGQGLRLGLELGARARYDLDIRITGHRNTDSLVAQNIPIIDCFYGAINDSLLFRGQVRGRRGWTT
jgi:hypothetical protein